MALQTCGGVIEGLYYLPATPSTVSWGRLPTRDSAPVLQVEPGAVVTVDTVSHEGICADQGHDPLAWFGARGVASADVLRDTCAVARGCPRPDPEQDGPHVLTGPVAVRGAEPGDRLTVEVLALRLRTMYGVLSTRHATVSGDGRSTTGRRAPRAPARHVRAFCTVAQGADRLEAHVPLDGASGGDRDVLRVPLAPSVGLAAVATDTGARVSSADPPDGGAVVADLRSGRAASLPVRVPGALLVLGDPHYAQVDLGGVRAPVEAPLRVTLRLSLERPSAAVPAPR